LAKENRPGTYHGVRRACRPGFPSIVIDGEALLGRRHRLQHAGLDFVLDEKVGRDLLIFQVDPCSGAAAVLCRSRFLRGPAERERKTSAFSSRTRMKYRQEQARFHNARMALREC